MNKVTMAWLSLFGLALMVACTPEPSSVPQTEIPVVQGDAPWFRNVAAEKGVDFVHEDGRSGRRYYIETAASGGGWIDFDQDGDLDVYLLNGAVTPGSSLNQAPKNAFYENRSGHFVDITESVHLDDEGFGMGMCIGDLNGDGLPEIMVTNYGADRLFLNEGSHYKEISEQAGVAGDRWGTGAAFGDVDGDGDLDLYVANYVDFTFENNPQCGDQARSLGSYCRPSAFRGQPDYLYINQGNGTFVEEGRTRGINQGLEDRGFGVVMSDLNDDGALDILVANDGTSNRFYLNDGFGFFRDVSLESGFGFNGTGTAEAGMGIALGDADGDGILDPLVSNYSFESNTLYRQKEGLYFEDVSVTANIAQASFLPVGWGIQYLDFDNDGDLDFAVANGHVLDNVEQFDMGIGYAQANQLFRNEGTGTFESIGHQAGPVFSEKRVSRGLAAGDWNNDGRLDLLITNTNDRADLLVNELDTTNQWVGFTLLGSTSNRLAIGARVKLTKDEHLLGVREVRSGGSFLAQDDLRLHFGLGAVSPPFAAEIRWPGGRVDKLVVKDTNQYLSIDYDQKSPSLDNAKEGTK